jgi:hypothetical protein
VKHTITQKKGVLTMFNFFKKNRKNENDFFAVESKPYGKFIEYNYKTGYHKEFTFSKEEKNLVGAWICEVKVNGNEYNVVVF